MSPGRSLNSTQRQAVPSALGLTHASRVIPVVRSSEAESGIVTRLDVPLNESAPPKWPALDQDVVETLPALPVPEASATVVPLPSSNEYAATRPVDAPWARPASGPVPVPPASGTATSRASSSNRRIPGFRACRRTAMRLSPLVGGGRPQRAP